MVEAPSAKRGCNMMIVVVQMLCAKGRVLIGEDEQVRNVNVFNPTSGPRGDDIATPSGLQNGSGDRR